MTDKKYTPPPGAADISMEQICFGLDRATDEKSLIAYMAAFSDRSLLHILTSRMTDEEIHALVDYLTGLMKKHLTAKEYHRLFLSGSQVKRG